MATKKTEPADERLPEPSSAPPISDVAKPGETAAPPTSKPVIVGHGPTIKKDPMIDPDGSSNEKETEESTKPVTVKRELKLEPSAELKAATNGEEEENKKEEKSPEPVEPETEEKSESTSSESGEIDALAEEAEAKNKEKKAATEQEKLDVELQKVVDSKKYVLPIIEGGKKRSAERFVSWLFLILLLAAVGTWVAIDAGYLNVGLELPYDFIKD